jgi:hypothetical protein
MWTNRGLNEKGNDDNKVHVCLLVAQRRDTSAFIISSLEAVNAVAQQSLPLWTSGTMIPRR